LLQNPAHIYTQRMSGYTHPNHEVNIRVKVIGFESAHMHIWGAKRKTCDNLATF